jgi:hypothetical protein
MPLVVDTGAGISFEFTKAEGAALRIRQPTFRRDLKRSRVVERFVAQEHEKWLTYAYDNQGLDFVRPEELLFVTGVHKTAQFNALTYSGSSGSLGLTLHVGTPGIARVELDVSRTKKLSMQPLLQSESPPGNISPDQCIFLRAFSVESRKHNRRKSKMTTTVASPNQITTATGPQMQPLSSPEISANLTHPQPSTNSTQLLTTDRATEHV